MEEKAGVFETVRRLIKEQVKCQEEDIKLESDLIDNLGFDSLDEIELLMAIEEEYSIKIHDDVAERAENVGDIVKYIRENT